MPALDGIRGIAVSLVLLCHFVGAYEPTTTVGGIVYAVLRSGWCGVDLFFVLSGFLITGILVETKTAPNFFRSFYMRRFLRIFPLYYALLFVWFGVLGSLAARFGWDAYAIGRDRQLWYWAYLGNWLRPSRELVGAIAHLWTLAIEEQFGIDRPPPSRRSTTRSSFAASSPALAPRAMDRRPAKGAHRRSVTT